MKTQHQINTEYKDLIEAIRKTVRFIESEKGFCKGFWIPSFINKMKACGAIPQDVRIMPRLAQLLLDCRESRLLNIPAELSMDAQGNVQCDNLNIPFEAFVCEDFTANEDAPMVQEALSEPKTFAIIAPSEEERQLKRIADALEKMSSDITTELQFIGHMLDNIKFVMEESQKEG